MAERRATRRWLLFLPPALFGLLAGLFLAGMLRDNPDALPSTLVGRPAPPLALAAIPGLGPAPDAAALRSGTVTLVNFWASWCAPCRVEHPMLEDLAAQGIPIIGINYKDDPEKARAFLQELGNPYTATGADHTGRTALAWGVYGVPETYILAPDGTITFRFAGPITQSILTSTIIPEIEKAKQK
jgi:cytochrome c biogenesis protein CcmG/thiol:disulfide interchange protein DsbE